MCNVGLRPVFNVGTLTEIYVYYNGIVNCAPLKGSIRRSTDGDGRVTRTVMYGRYVSGLSDRAYFVTYSVSGSGCVATACSAL